MSPDTHRPGPVEKHHARWTVYAAVLGAVVAATLGHFFSHDVTDARLLEIKAELARERDRTETQESPIQAPTEAPAAHRARTPPPSPDQRHSTGRGRVASESKSAKLFAQPLRSDASVAMPSQLTGTTTAMTATRVGVGSDTPLRALPREKARLTFSVEPTDASIYLDNQYKGSPTELADGIPIEDGDHLLNVVRSGFVGYEHSINVNGGESQAIKVELHQPDRCKNLTAKSVQAAFSRAAR